MHAMRQCIKVKRIPINPCDTVYLFLALRHLSAHSIQVITAFLILLFESRTALLNLGGIQDDTGTLLKYLVRVSEIGRYFSWHLLCDRACPVQPPAFFLSRVLLLGFGKLLSIKKKCYCRFVVMCVGFTTNCQNKSRSKSLPPDIHSLLLYTSRPMQ